MQISVTEHNVHITDSCTISKKLFEPILKDTKKDYPDSKVWERSMKSLCAEWAVHNFCYMIGFQKERTKDCDLDNPCDKPQWLYMILGSLVWPLIK